MTKSSFISGAFDGCHRGHLHILTEAAKLGRLIVCINNDEYVARKGPGRPLRNEFERTEDLYKTGLVSEVIIIRDSPLNTILFLQPDYIFVGDDYTLDRVIGAEESKSWGGKVIIIPRIPGYSTTSLIK